MLRLVTFGGLSLLDDDDPVAGAAARGRNLALLALLARTGKPGLTREKLAAYLWPESEAGRARHSLDQALYTLRRALGPDTFVAGGTTLSLNDDVIRSDVAAFTTAVESDAMRRAVDLYAGPFLDGFHLSDAAEFERWVDRERSALRGRYAAALEGVAEEAAAKGDHAEAVRLWRRLAAAEPLSSRVALGLMKALDEAGDRAGAIQAAGGHAALVREELDAPPDASVLEYADALRRPPESDTGSAQPSSAGRPRGKASGRPAGARGEAASPDGWSVDPATVPGGAARSAAPARSPSRARAWAAVAVLAAVLAAGAALLTDPAAPAAGEPPRVAVTPFDNETGDPAFEPVGRMAADWITEGLVRTGLVQVIDRDAGGGSAESVVSGRVYRTGDTIWLQARITRPENGVVLRALDAVGTTAGSPSRAVESLRQQVLGALGTLYDPRLTALAESALRPPSYAAYREFAAGLELHAVPRDLAGAAERFRRAAELDPDYVLPRLWLAWASILAGELGRADSVTGALDAYRDRMSPLERAWHDRIAALLAGDNEASYRAAERMVEIAPRSVWVIALANAALDTNRPGVAVAALRDAGIDNLGLERDHGWFLLTTAYHRLGDHRAELAATERAIRTDGLGWGYTGPGVPALAALGRIDALRRRLDELRGLPAAEGEVPFGARSLLPAVVELRAHGYAHAAASLADDALERSPEPAGDEAGPARWARVQLFYELGRWSDAERALRRAGTHERAGLRYRAMAGLLAARRGDTATARRVAREMAALDRPFLFGEPTFWRARIEAVLGSGETAVALLRQAFAEGQSARAWHWVHVGRDFDPLRRLPSFRELVRARA